MKVLLRTVAILAAALLVVAGLNAFMQSGYGQGLLAASPGRGELDREGERPAGFEVGQPEMGQAGVFEGRRGHHSDGPSLRGLAEAGKSLIIVAIIVTLVALGGRLLQLFRRERGPARL